MIYFIADLHFGHKNVMSYDNRPFKTIEENDETIIKNWNKTVGTDDEVYLLGDISWYNATKTLEILNNLNGNIHLIKGNHDDRLLRNRDIQKRFAEIVDYKELSLIYSNNKIILCHYPIPCFKNHYYGAYHLYGHVHTGFEDNMMENIKIQMMELHNVPCNMYNIGCMKPYMNYTPRTLEEITKGAEEKLCCL